MNLAKVMKNNKDNNGDEKFSLFSYRERYGEAITITDRAIAATSLTLSTRPGLRTGRIAGIDWAAETNSLNSTEDELRRRVEELEAIVVSLRVRLDIVETSPINR